ncbi:acyl-CoA dehydrogenase [Microtetraspora sp. NBRC 13810]|uniref:phosphotransferase family protein n=1 Tax=Microtetraspora sp. NBRC 13810 TaxID=3030990 RepID=UPI0024A025CC|nr:phosphotransferase family protein [Microtetraspora sp. NBRC 13810]GLW12349.1 acyl-CoA dehydrogenase [Microtetraspora sp. NBRC 13810]
MNTPGIDWPRLVRWMSAHVPDAGEPTGISVISGGRSNLTYLVQAEARRVVLRRPPLGHVLPTAHDMSREFRVISALAATPVPVPEPLAFCSDEDVIGAPFYLMGHVAGDAIRTAEELTGLGVGADGARRLSERLAEILAAVHAVDYEEAGLGDFGRPEGYMARQLRRWNQQWERSKTRELPEYDRLVTRLGERLPGRSGATLVHGDYRLDNTLVGLGPDGGAEIRAVVDWEMSTLGDPLADLGLTLTYWHDADDAVPVAGSATTVPGFLGPREFAAHYAKTAGTDLGDLDFYLAFGRFKLAVILEGIHARYQQGKTVGEGFGTVGAGVPHLVARAHRILDGA